MNLPLYKYDRAELELFSNARNWKNYSISKIVPHVKGDVLEIGAGIGSNTEVFFKATSIREKVKSWTCLEPDKAMADFIDNLIRAEKLPGITRVINGTIYDIEESKTYDSIIYIDVLEHITEDKKEIAIATRRLKKNGELIVLSPAHQWLFSPFDKAVGHHQRYSRKSLSSLKHADVDLVSMRYLDSAGIFLSLGNRIILQRNMPTIQQIKFWDGYIIPVSRILDKIHRYSIGKSILAIWRRNT
jgi:SAM-dependent methyltransferase